jgi:hypothetical protein
MTTCGDLDPSAQGQVSRKGGLEHPRPFQKSYGYHQRPAPSTTSLLAGSSA